MSSCAWYFFTTVFSWASGFVKRDNAFYIATCFQKSKSVTLQCSEGLHQEGAEHQVYLIQWVKAVTWARRIQVGEEGNQFLVDTARVNSRSVCGETYSCVNISEKGPWLLMEKTKGFSGYIDIILRF